VGVGVDARTPSTPQEDIRRAMRDGVNGIGRNPRTVDGALAAVAVAVLITLGLMELASGPQLATRLLLSLAWRVANRLDIVEYYPLIAAWKGWHSLEIGLELTGAIMLGFSVWLLFAVLFDCAGILIGLVPAGATATVALLFRFHARSVLLPAVVLPAVLVPAAFAAHALDQRWYRSAIVEHVKRIHSYQKAIAARRGGGTPTSAGGAASAATSSGFRQQQQLRHLNAAARSHSSHAFGGMAAAAAGANGGFPNVASTSSFEPSASNAHLHGMHHSHSFGLDSV